MGERLKQISLRKFRMEIDEIHEPVDVARRDAEGNLQVLGYWTPYMQWDAGAPLDPVSGVVEAAPLKRLRIERMPPGTRTRAMDDNELLALGGGTMSTIDEVELRRLGLSEDIQIDPSDPPIDPRTFNPPRASFGYSRPVPKTIRKK